MTDILPLIIGPTFDVIYLGRLLGSLGNLDIL